LNPFNPGAGNAQTEKDLSEGPDLVADSLFKWRKATIEREKTDALLFLQFKADGEKRTGDEIKAMVRADGGHYKAALDEAIAESEYTRLLERLYSAKKAASLRTAF